MFHAIFFKDYTQNGEEFSGSMQMACDCTYYENDSNIKIKTFTDLTSNNRD